MPTIEHLDAGEETREEMRRLMADAMLSTLREMEPHDDDNETYLVSRLLEAGYTPDQVNKAGARAIRAYWQRDAEIPSERDEHWDWDAKACLILSAVPMIVFLYWLVT